MKLYVKSREPGCPDKTTLILLFIFVLLSTAGCSAKLDYNNPKPKYMKRLFEEFTDYENENHDLAAGALSKLGKRPVPRLIKLLSTDDGQMRIDAALVLGDIGPDAHDAIPVLIPFLEDDDELGLAASRALGEIGPQSAPALFEVLDGYNNIARKNAAKGFGWMGPSGKDSAVELIKLFWDTKLRSDLAYSLGQMGPDILPLLLLALRDTDTELRRGAAEAIGYIGHDAVEHTPELITALNDKEAPVRIEAAIALGRVADSREAAIALTDFLGEEHDWMFPQVKESLVQLGKVSIPPLIEAIKVKNNVYRSHAALALAEIEGDKSEAIPTLIEMTAVPSSDVQESAAIAIESIGPEAIEAAGVLKKLIRNGVAGVRAHGIKALDAVRAYDDESVRILIDAFDDPEPRVSSVAVDALSHFGTNAHAPLLKALHSTDERVYTRASHTLGYMGANASDVIPELTTMLTDRTARLRSVAVTTLGLMGTVSVDSIPAMSELLGDNDASVRMSAAEAIGSLGPAAATVVAKLTDALDDDDRRVRLAATDALGNIGPDASSALPKLKELLADTRKGKHNYDVIAEAIAKIEGENSE